MPLARFVPDAKNIESFEDLCVENGLSDETKIAAKYVMSIFAIVC